MNIMRSFTQKKIKTVVGFPEKMEPDFDVYFSADIETDGPIPGPYSMLSFALVYAGAFDGNIFYKPPSYAHKLYTELKPISQNFQQEALNVNGLNREVLARSGLEPRRAMTDAAAWVRGAAQGGEPVFVAYPLSFDWSWVYWYFVNFSETESPFGYSRCLDLKTAIAVKLGRTIGHAARQKLPEILRPNLAHTHHALDDAIAQAEILANLFAMEPAFG